MFNHGEICMAFEPLTKKEKEEIKKDVSIVESDFHQVSELGQVTLVVSSHVDERKFVPVDYVNIYAKEKTKQINHSIDFSDALIDRGIDPNGFMIIVDITKDKKVASMEIIRM